jgi:hypothetical protein
MGSAGTILKWDIDRDQLADAPMRHSAKDQCAFIEHIIERSSGFVSRRCVTTASSKWTGSRSWTVNYYPGPKGGGIQI